MFIIVSFPLLAFIYSVIFHPCGFVVLIDLPRWMGHSASWRLRCLGIGIAITGLSLTGFLAARLMLGGVRSRLDRHQYPGCASVDINLLRCNLFTAWSLITWAAHAGVWATTGATVLTRRLAIRWKIENKQSSGK